MELFADMLCHVLCRFKIVAFALNLVSADFFSGQDIAHIIKIIVDFIIIDGLFVDDIVFDKTVDDIIRISSDRRCEMTIINFGKTEVTEFFRRIFSLCKSAEHHDGDRSADVVVFNAFQEIIKSCTAEIFCFRECFKKTKLL